MSPVRSILLFSAGLDSTVNLFIEAQLDRNILCLTFDYGQGAAGREVERAARIASGLGVEHETVKLGWFGSISSSLSGPVVPDVELSELEGPVAEKNAGLVWVPNRNGVFVNIGAAYAEALGADRVVAGFNLEEAQTFPDNSSDFVAASNAAFAYSTRNRVELVSHTIGMDKKMIVAEAFRLNIPWQELWVCYRGGVKMCGRCESCRRTARALSESGLTGEARLEFDDNLPE